MFTLSNVALLATGLSAAAFGVVAVFGIIEQQWLITGLYIGLAVANTCLAIMAYGSAVQL